MANITNKDPCGEKRRQTEKNANKSLHFHKENQINIQTDTHNNIAYLRATRLLTGS